MPKFAVGDRVRVRAGTTDPDNPDLPIGLWCGVIDEADETESPVSYFVRWDQRTRDHMPPLFVNRCRVQNLEIETMWLDEEQLEADSGEQLPIELPLPATALSIDDPDPDNRLRAVFGLSAADEVPEVEEVSLRLYHAHLLSHMTLPFEASWDSPFAQSLFKNVKVEKLLPVETNNVKDGLICEVDSSDGKGSLPLFLLKTAADAPQARQLADYSRWFEEWNPRGGVLPFRGAEGDTPRLPLRKLLVYSGVMGAVYGGTLGAITAVREGARLGMIIGAAVFAILLGVLGRRWGMIIGAMRGTRNGPLMGMLLGMALGGTLGVLLGTLAVVFLGAITGCIVASLLADGLVRTGRRGPVKFLAAILGACTGGVVQVITENREEAMMGVLIGGVVGIVAGLLVVMVTLATLVALLSRRGV